MKLQWEKRLYHIFLLLGCLLQAAGFPHFHFAIVSKAKASSFVFISYYVEQSFSVQQAVRTENLISSVCSGELNFNLSRVIRALRAASGDGFRSIEGRPGISEINNFY